MDSFDFKPILVQYRSGMDDSPYISLTESTKVINQRIQLSEIPAFNSKVQISGMVEIQNLDQTPLFANAYYVDYQEGIVHFHASKEGQTLTLNYMGKGAHYISAARVWSKESNGEVTETLEDVLIAGEQALENIANLEQTITEAETATQNANSAAANVNTAINSANTATLNANNAAQAANASAESAGIASENANSATSSANVAATNATNAANTANSAANAANTAKENAEFATTNATNATISANNAATSADVAATNANNAIEQLIHLGDYNSETTYYKNNSVRYNGSTYKCIQESTGNLPSNTTFWQLEAMKGQDGAGTVATIISTNGDIAIGGTPQDITLTLNSGVNANQIVKRNGNGNIQDVIDINTVILNFNRIQSQRGMI